MSNNRKREKSKEKRCQQCFAYVPFQLRKCKFCGYKFKSTGKFLLDKIKSVLRINSVYSLQKTSAHGTYKTFFTLAEVDQLSEMSNIKVILYFILSDLSYMDEISLIELGKTLSAVNED